MEVANQPAAHRSSRLDDHLRWSFHSSLQGLGGGGGGGGGMGRWEGAVDEGESRKALPERRSHTRIYLIHNNEVTYRAHSWIASRLVLFFILARLRKRGSVDQMSDNIW